ncbi:MAG: 3D domain-containing protein [Acidobacteriota bacterium]|nr:3D domain-containing protein [Acidobacteriota bacterium]
MKPFICRSGVIAAALLSSSFILSATTSVAETSLLSTQQQKQRPNPVKAEMAVPTSNQDRRATSGDSAVAGTVIEATDPAGGPKSAGNSHLEPATSPVHYTATAYSLNGRTASGKPVSKGLIAGDPSVLPLGTRVRLEAGNYSGEYVVADTGGSVRGKRIDIWTPTSREAMRFGRRLVKLTVLSYGPRSNAMRKQRNR